MPNSYPIGGMIIFPGSALPTGWLECNGAEVSRGIYDDLYGVIGTTYGVGDGVNTFNLPDMRGRVPIGASPGSLDSIRISERITGDGGGEETHVLIDSEMPSHRHDNIYANLSAAGGGSTISPHCPLVDKDLPYGVGIINGSYTGNAGGGVAHNNMPPFLVVNKWIIKY